MVSGAVKNERVAKWTLNERQLQSAWTKNVARENKRRVMKMDPNSTSTTRQRADPRRRRRRAPQTTEGLKSSALFDTSSKGRELREDASFGRRATCARQTTRDQAPVSWSVVVMLPVVLAILVSSATSVMSLPSTSAAWGLRYVRDGGGSDGKPAFRLRLPREATGEWGLCFFLFSYSSISSIFRIQ